MLGDVGGGTVEHDAIVFDRALFGELVRVEELFDGHWALVVGLRAEVHVRRVGDGDAAEGRRALAGQGQTVVGLALVRSGRRDAERVFVVAATRALRIASRHHSRWLLFYLAKARSGDMATDISALIRGLVNCVVCREGDCQARPTRIRLILARQGKFVRLVFP